MIRTRTKTQLSDSPAPLFPSGAAGEMGHGGPDSPAKSPSTNSPPITCNALSYHASRLLGDNAPLIISSAPNKPIACQNAPRVSGGAKGETRGPLARCRRRFWCSLDRYHPLLTAGRYITFDVVRATKPDISDILLVQQPRDPNAMASPRHQQNLAAGVLSRSLVEKVARKIFGRWPLRPVAEARPM